MSEFDAELPDKGGEPPAGARERLPSAGSASRESEQPTTDDSKARQAFIDREVEITKFQMQERYLKEVIGPDGRDRLQRSAAYAAWYWDEVLPEREKERLRQAEELARASNPKEEKEK